MVQKQWIVNEAQNDFYPWKDRAEFRVLSPASIQLNSTELPEGLAAMTLRTPFEFIVVHRDPNPSRDFMFRAEIPLIIAPIRSVEVLTPQVAMFHDADICVRLRSNTRDRLGGVFYVDDPIVSSPQEKIELEGKNYVLTDTLPLTWKDASAAAPHEVRILADGKIPIGGFFAHRLNVKSTSDGEVGVCTVVENSPVVTALRRLGTRTKMLEVIEPVEKDLSECSAIIIDQFSLWKFTKLLSRPLLVKEWIAGGGKLIILPQYGFGDGDIFPGTRVDFSYLPIVGCNDEIEIDTAERVLHAPNEISGLESADDPFVISYGGITNIPGDNSKALIRSGAQTLLSQKRIGRGAIFYCALNLYPKLLEIDQNAYRLLGNLLDY